MCYSPSFIHGAFQDDGRTVRMCLGRVASSAFGSGSSHGSCCRPADKSRLSPADAGAAMLSLRNVLVPVAVGGLVWWVGHLGAQRGGRQRDEAAPVKPTFLCVMSSSSCSSSPSAL